MILNHPSISAHWIKHPLILVGQTVELRPLEEEHFDALGALSQDERIWTHLQVNGSIPEKFLSHLEEALDKRQKGEHYPFVIFDRLTGQMLGSTRYFEIFPEHRKLEIGWTWIHPDYWGSGVNTECKFLMLREAFEGLGAVRVQIKAAESNLRSRRAIENLGAVYEGTFRKDRIREDGSVRNSVYYSILDEEWPQIRHRLEIRMAEASTILEL